ncbi:hypothetical protein BSL78_00434 [Apostichopus japonicus]|uniref:Uncharacterized protein n=1 Tax=Stichopus japonicus TaxID=307972 RepID=A0A2G8LQZ1_STIJA|nr:hypothetical protein BSL78_00434 [Apostichopus japonicus]
MVQNKKNMYIRSRHYCLLTQDTINRGSLDIEKLNKSLSFNNLTQIHRQKKTTHKENCQSCTGSTYEIPCFGDSNCCIYSSYFCDTIIDCPNGFDEQPHICANIWKTTCDKEAKFNHVKPFELAQCDDGMCITECDVCDGYYLDCTDGSDEDPELCNSDSRPAIQGDCTQFRQGYPIPDE